MDATALQTALDGIAAEFTSRLGLRVTAVDGAGVTLVLPAAPELVHGGGVVCGQALLAAADTAMLVAMIAAQGGVRPMTTVQLGLTFLRPVPKDAGDVSVVARVLRSGKSLCYGSVDLSTADGKLAAQATVTYALL